MGATRSVVEGASAAHAFFVTPLTRRATSAAQGRRRADLNETLYIMA
jgi:hypothetical protein